MVKSIIKRVVVSAATILILGFISSILYIPNVFAEELSSPVEDSSSNSNNNGIPIVVGVPNGDTLYEQNHYITNINPNNMNNLSPILTFNQLMILNPNNDCNDYRCLYSIDSSYSPFNLTSFISNIPLPVPQSSAENSLSFLTSFTLGFNPIFEVKEGNHYSMMYFLRKVNTSVFYNDNPNIELLHLDMGYVTNNGLVEYDIKDVVDNLVVSYHVVKTKTTSDSNLRQTKDMYITVDFDISDDSIDTIFSGTKYITSFSFDFPNEMYNPDIVQLPINYFMSNTSSSGDTPKQVSQYFYFIENGNIQYTGIDCNNINETCHSGMSYNGSFDYIHTDDIGILDSQPICADNDIICHLKNIKDMVWRVLVRFGNFMESLLSGTINWDLDTNSDMTPISNLLTMPLTLINSLISGIDSLCVSYNLGTLYNYQFVLPCINLQNILGSVLWGSIDDLFSIFMCFNIGKLIIKYFDQWTSMNSNFGMYYNNNDFNGGDDF